MKAKKLVLCIFLSLALIISFIPMMSYAAPGDSHEVSFNGTSFSYDSGEGEYYAHLDHGTIWVDESYNSSKKCFDVEEGYNFWVYAECESGWSSIVQYSISDGNRTDAVYNGGGSWYIPMPENAGNYTINVFVSTVRTTYLNSANVTLNAPPLWYRCTRNQL